MFGNNKEEQASKNGMGNSKARNHFGEGTVIVGEIKSEGFIRIEGKIIGTVHSSAKIAIGPTGKVEGDIFCHSADIEGKVKGRLEIKDLLHLRNTSVIDGDMISAKLVVEEGAKFNGTCSMGAAPQRSAKELKHDKKAAALEKEAI